MALKYLLLAEELEKEIQSRYPGDYRLPPERELAERCRVSRQTVRQALLVLEEKGLITKRAGSGSYANRERKERLTVLTPVREDYLLAMRYRDMQEADTQGNCVLQVLSTGGSVSRERELLQEFVEHPPDGLCVEGTLSALPNPNLDLYRRLLDRRVPLLFMGAAYAGLEKAVSVAMDNEAGGYLAVRYLAEKGHKTVGLLMDFTSLQGTERYAGCVSALRDYALPLRDDCFLWYDGSGNRFSPRETAQEALWGEPGGFHRAVQEGFFRAAAEQLAGRCSAVICQNEEAGRLLGWELRKRRPPTEAPAVFCFREHIRGGEGEGQPAGLVCREGPLGRVACRKLLGMMEGKRETSVKLEWSVL